MFVYIAFIRNQCIVIVNKENSKYEGRLCHCHIHINVVPCRQMQNRILLEYYFIAYDCMCSFNSNGSGHWAPRFLIFSQTFSRTHPSSTPFRIFKYIPCKQELVNARFDSKWGKSLLRSRRGSKRRKKRTISFTVVRSINFS